MSKDLGLAIAAGIASGLVFLSVFAGGALGILLMYLTPLPLIMVGLSLGLWRGLISSGVALVMVAAATPDAVSVYGLVAPLPAMVVTRQALLWRQRADGTVEWYPPGLLLAWLAIVAVALMALGALLIPTRGMAFEAMAQRYVVDFLDQVAPTAPTDVKEGAAALWSALFPAMLACGWLLMTMANAIVAQWTVSRAGHGRRPTPAYATVELPWWLLAALGAATAVGLLAGGDLGYLGRNAAAVLLWPYVFVGLAVVHRALRRRTNGSMLLALFYVAFFAMFGWALLAVAGLGLVWHGNRLLHRGTDSSQEEK
jgi:hypothetical protein